MLVFLRFFPVAGFREAASHIDGDEDGDDAGEEQRAPTPPRVPGLHPADQVFIDLCGEEDAESVAGKEEAGCFVPHVDRP